MDQIKSLHKPSIVLWLYNTVQDWVIIALCFLLAQTLDNIASYWLCSLVIGNRAHAIAIMGHDAAHYTLSRNKLINDLIANLVCFWPLGMTMEGYRSFHLQHHRFTGTKNDPELTHKKWVYPQFEPPFRLNRQLAYVLYDLAGYGLIWIYQMSKFILPKNKQHLLPVVFIHLSFITTCCLLEQYWVPALWYFSNCTSFWATMRMRIWTEHVGTNGTSRVGLRWWHRVLFSPHWTEYHYEHHAWPSVPCWNLPKLRNLIKEPRILSDRELYKALATHGREQ